MAQKTEDKKPRDLWQEVCSKENLFIAYLNARKNKTKKQYVLEFEKNLNVNLANLRLELFLHSYRPKPLKHFTIKDPKTRKISKSDFKDRIVHHALVRVIEPIFDKAFIYDSYANRKRKGTLKAIQRFDEFKRKTSKNNTSKCFVLKADIKHYFQTVDHIRLITLIKKRVKDKSIIWLIRIILANHKTNCQEKGMPLGNLTSQFFANIYLNELDQFVKHKLKAEKYIRYVDDFVILSQNSAFLEYCKEEIDIFLEKDLKLMLHPDKTRIIDLKKGITFLGFRIFENHKIIKKSNLRKFKSKIGKIAIAFKEACTTQSEHYTFYEGWSAYARNADTYNLRMAFSQEFEKYFAGKLCDKEIIKYEKIYSKMYYSQH